MNLAYETAIHWISLGFPILPVRFLGKRAMVDWKEYQDRLPRLDEVKKWFHSSIMNIGLIVGNGLVVIDFDIMDVFEHWLSTFLEKYPQGTYMVKTRRGMHVYVHTELQANNHHNPMLDIKAERGYVLIPPSVHPSGAVYTVWQDAPILHVEKLEDVLPVEYMPVAECVEAAARPQYERIDDPWAEAFQAAESRSIQEIRARVSILDLLPDAVPSDRAGRWFVASCPFHEDTNPSFWIDTERGICGCHKCNIKSMDAINLFSRLNHVSNAEAIRELSGRL
jgi:hypothetical protein